MAFARHDIGTKDADVVELVVDTTVVAGLVDVGILVVAGAVGIAVDGRDGVSMLVVVGVVSVAVDHVVCAVVAWQSAKPS